MTASANQDRVCLTVGYQARPIWDKAFCPACWAGIPIGLKQTIGRIRSRRDAVTVPARKDLTLDLYVATTVAAAQVPDANGSAAE